MMNKIKREFAQMPITQKIMMLYAVFFTVTIAAISVVLLFTAQGMGVGITFTSLQNCSKNIESYIMSGQELTNEAIQSIIGNSYVDYIIENKTKRQVFVSVDFCPDESESMPIDRDELPDDLEKGLNLRERGIKKGYLVPIGKGDYSIYTKNGYDFISIKNEFVNDGNVYTVKLFKASLDKIVYVRYIAIRLLYINIIGMIIASLIGLYISGELLRPVRRIRETAARISVEDLSQRIEITGPDDEIKELSITFNSMIDRLERSFEQQSRFVSDASHELRTPISVIKGYANLINRWGKDDPDILQEAVNNILEETDYMSVMIKNLLFLAKSDQQRLNVHKRPMPINEAVLDISKDLRVTNEKIDIVTEISDNDVIINGDPDLIKQMLWIYTENAVKYSGENKKIEYQVYTEGDYVCVSVKDNGFGIGEADLPHIFERFYRVDKSRNKDISGNGLGLAIAKWIVDVHNGKVEVRSTIGEGTEFISKFKTDN